MPSSSANGGNNNNNNRDEQRSSSTRTGSGSRDRNTSGTNRDARDILRTFNWGALNESLRNSLSTAIRFVTTSESPADLQREAAAALDRFNRTATFNMRRSAYTRPSQRSHRRTQPPPPRGFFTLSYQEEEPQEAAGANPEPSTNSQLPHGRPLQREYAFYGADDMPRALRWNNRGGPDPIYNPPEAAPWARPTFSRNVTAARASPRASAPTATVPAPTAGSSNAPNPTPTSGATDGPSPGRSTGPSLASGASNAPAQGASNSPGPVPGPSNRQAPASGPSNRHVPAPRHIPSSQFGSSAPRESAPADVPYDFRANATRLLSSPEGVAALVAAADHQALIRAFIATDTGINALFDVMGTRGLATLVMEREDGLRAVETIAENHWHAANRARARMTRLLQRVDLAEMPTECPDREGGAEDPVQPARELPAHAQELPVSINDFLDDVGMAESSAEQDMWSQVSQAGSRESDAGSDAGLGEMVPNAEGSGAGTSLTVAEPSQALAQTPDSPTRGTKRTREEEPQGETRTFPSAEGRRVIRRRLSDGSAVARTRPARSMRLPRARSAPASAMWNTPETAIYIVDSDDESERTMRSPTPTTAKRNDAPL